MGFQSFMKKPVEWWLYKSLLSEDMVKVTQWLCLLKCCLFLSTEEQEESIYNLYISEVRNIRLRLESCEERLIRQIRTPMERDDLHESVFRISEQEVSLWERLFYLEYTSNWYSIKTLSITSFLQKLKKELDRLKDDLGGITDKCEEFFSQAAGSPSVPTLRSELNIVIQNMNQVYSMSSIYIDKYVIGHLPSYTL